MSALRGRPSAPRGNSDPLETMPPAEIIQLSRCNNSIIPCKCEYLSSFVLKHQQAIELHKALARLKSLRSGCRKQGIGLDGSTNSDKAVTSEGDAFSAHFLTEIALPQHFGVEFWK